MILDRIVADRKKDVEAAKQHFPLAQLEDISPGRDLVAAVKKSSGVGIIAEVKQASPSRGIIRQDFNPLAIAEEYQANNVAGISVLTEPQYFRGRDEYLTTIVTHTTTPILRKDFIIDPYQIIQSKLLGADCILLIAAALTDAQLVEFKKLATELKLQCLVEVHDRLELARALAAEAEFIGINNRDLRTFQTDLATTLTLAPLIPEEIVVISESGINTRAEMMQLEAAGVDGVLIGESLMRAPDISLKLQELRGEADG